MPETRTYQGQTYQRNAPDEPWVRVGGQEGSGVFRDPYRAAEEDRAERAAELDAMRVAIAQQNTNIAAQSAALNAQKAQQDLTTAGDEQAATEEAQETKNVRRRLNYGNILDAIQKSRNIAARGGVGWSSLLSSLPETDARELEAALAPILGNLSFERLQQMRDESETGGALGSITERELDLLGSTVASLDTGVSLSEFLDNLNRVEQHFVNSQIALSGIDPTSDEGAALLAEYVGPQFDPSGTNPLSQEQQQLIEAFYSANPNFTADDLRSFTQAMHMPEIENIGEIVAARNAGSGVAPAAFAQATGDWDQTRLSQGASGINEGLAYALGLPVDAFTGAVNLTTGGMNWLNEALGGDPAANLPAIENPAGGSDWMIDNLTNASMIREGADTDEGQFWRRVGQSVGASAAPGMGAGRSAGSVASALLSGAGGGLGAATARDAFPGNSSAELTGEIIGALMGGGAGVAGATRAARNEARSAVPSTEQLKGEAGRLYEQAEARGVVAGPELTTELVDSLDEIARREALVSAKGRVSEAYPKIAPVLKTIQDEAGETLTPKRIQVLRETLADAAYTTEGKEQRIATDMLRAFDEVTVPLAPELAEARTVASRYLQARPIEQAIDVAENTRAGQFSQSGLDNALRTDFANLQRRAIRGGENFSPEVLESISEVTNPSGARQAARWAGRLAPNSQLGMGLTASPAGIGFMTGEPVAGALASGGLAMAGGAGRKVADSLAMRQAQDAVLTARKGGSLRLPDASDTDAWDAVAAALLAQGSPYVGQNEEEREIASLLAQTQFAEQ